MIRMVYYELYKAVRKKGFLIAASCLLLINAGLLFYSCFAGGSGGTAAAYKHLMKDIGGRPEQEKYDYVEGLYNTISGVELVEEIQTFEAAQSDAGRIMADNLRKENPGVFEEYYEAWRDGSYLRYTDSLKSEHNLIKEVYDEEQAAAGYKDYLKDISQTSSQLSGVSIFSSSENDGFSSRNIKKTAEDYSGMADVEVAFSPSRGFSGAASSKLTDVLVLLSILAFSSGLIFEEKEKGLYAITKATARGGCEHIAAKLAALFIYCAAATVLFYGCSLAFYGGVYGLGNVNAPLQSYAPFIGSALPLTGLQYLIISYGAKAVVSFFIGTIIVLLSILAKQSYLPAIVSTAFLGLCYGLTSMIPAVSGINWLKYLNPYGLLQTDKLYGGYINLNFFGRPISCHKAAEALLAAALVLLCFLCLASFKFTRNMGLKELHLTQWLKKLSIVNFHPHTSLLRYEGYKIFVTAGVLPILLVFGTFLVYNTGKASYYISSGERRYSSYMEYLAGPLNDEKASYLEDENAMYEDAMKQVQLINEMEESGEISSSAADSLRLPYQSTLSFYGAFQRAWEKYRYIQSHPKAEFVYETGYMLLLGLSSDNAVLRFLLLTVVITFCLGNVYAMEHKHDMYRMIASTSKGRRRVSLCKLIISLIITVHCFLAVEGAYLTGVARSYPLPEIASPVTSIMAYSYLPDSMPIWAFIGIIAIIRLAAVMTSALIILLISSKLHSSLQGIFLSVLALGLSPILYIMGMPAAKWIGFLPLYMSPMLLEDDRGLLVLCGYILCTVIICIGCVYSLRNAFSEAALIKKKIVKHGTI
jgi:hypothetical protein